MAKPKRPAHKKTKKIITKKPTTSNWERLKPQLTKGAKKKGSKHAARDLTDALQQAKTTKSIKKPHTVAPDTYVALDCEMVGVGSNGRESALARCSVVDEQGKVLYDRHVQVDERVTDFRTKYSGVRAKDLKNDSVTFRDCQQKVAALLRGKILVGHALSNDLKVLLLPHPRQQMRDTARWPPLMRTTRHGKRRPRKLRDLVLEHLDRKIQEGEHGSVEDATAAMDLYKRFAADWEASLRASSA